MPTDRPKFSSLDGSTSLPMEGFHLPSPAWEWTNDWTHEQSPTDVIEFIIESFLFKKKFNFLFVYLLKGMGIRGRLSYSISP